METERGDGSGANAGPGILSSLQALLSSSGLKPSPDNGLFLEEDMISETKKLNVKSSSILHFTLVAGYRLD